jgi:hypothetical protein
MTLAQIIFPRQRHRDGIMLSSTVEEQAQSNRAATFYNFAVLDVLEGDRISLFHCDVYFLNLFLK